MIADRMINAHNSQIIACTAPNGDTCWTNGVTRQRYSYTDKTKYWELFYNGKWYLDYVEREADITFTDGVGFTTPGTTQTTLIESPVQDIN